MRTRTWLLLSLALNFFFLGFAGVTYWKKQSRPQRAAAKKAFNPFEFSTRTNVVVRRLNFTWQEVESEDYATYIQNLRTIGCPETTIRDIIVADVDQLYTHRRSTEVNVNDSEWWRSDPDPAEIQRADEKLNGLEQERRAMLTRLLGPEWEQPSEPMSPAMRLGINLSGPVLGDLPDETKQAVYGIAEGARNKSESYLKTQRELGQEADPAELIHMRQQMRDELAQVLSPEQLEEYLLRYSETAEQMRQEFRGFELSPEDFRAIFRVRDPVQREAALIGDQQDPVSAAKRNALQTQVEEGLRQTLGEERYLTYKLNQDPLFQETKARAEQFGLSAELLLSLYEINQETEAERLRIRLDPALSSEEKIEALAGVTADQQKSLQRLLGEDTFTRWIEGAR